MGVPLRQSNDNNGGYYIYNQPPRNTNYLPYIIIFIICIVSAVTYYLSHTEQVQNPDAEVVSEQMDYFVSKVNINSEGNVLQKMPGINAGITSNRNGVVMAQSMDTISDILECAFEVDEDVLENNITVIQNVNLSTEYDRFKEKMCLKLEYALKFKQNPCQEYLDEWERIDYVIEAAQAFDQANVDYQILEEGKRIRYWYHVD